MRTTTNDIQNALRKLDKVKASLNEFIDNNNIDEINHLRNKFQSWQRKGKPPIDYDLLESMRKASILHRKLYRLQKKKEKLQKRLDTLRQRSQEVAALSAHEERDEVMNSNISMVENVPEEQQDEDNGRLSQNIVDEDNAMLSYEMEDTDIPHQICANCCRQQYTFNEDNPHFLVFVTCELKDIRKVRKFCFVSKEGDPHSDVILCQQCHVFLTNEDRKEANFFKYTWPAFMWCLIENNANRNIYGTKLWKFFPSDWRKWWYSSARLLFDTPISIDNRYFGFL